VSIGWHVGVTRISFYHHFEVREDLFQARLDDWAQRWT